MCKMYVVFVGLLFTGIRWTTEGAFVFTKTPERRNYFMEGSSASFEWNYSVDNKDTEFEFVIWNVIVDGNIITLLYENATEHVTLGPRIPAAFTGRVKKTGQATLVIENINFNDSVSFQCVLLQKSGRQNVDDVTLIVTGQATMSPQVQCAKAGNSVTFACNATGVPSEKFAMSRDYGESKELLGSRLPVLILKDVAVNASGYYECNATANPDQPNIARGYLEVIKPEPLQEDDKASLERSFPLAVGDNKTLCCPVKGYPPPFVTWEKNGTLLQRKLDKCLSITVAKDEDFANYSCSATDDTSSVGPYVFSLTEKRSIVVEASDSGKLKWSDVPGAKDYVVKITGDDVLEDVKCRVGKQPSMDLHFNALVLKEAEKNVEETNVCVKVVALSDDDDVLSKTPTCQSMTIKSGQVTLKPNVMFLVVIVYSGRKML